MLLEPKTIKGNVIKADFQMTDFCSAVPLNSLKKVYNNLNIECVISDANEAMNQSILAQMLPIIFVFREKSRKRRYT
jgi:hypothetical protein